MIESKFPTIRGYVQAIEIIRQGKMVKMVFEDMEEVWLRLYTKEKACPIVEQVGTLVKRNLVKTYTVELIRRMRGIINFDIISKSADPDSMFWIADDIVQRLSDNKTESHEGLFKSLLCAIFGVSIHILDFMMKDEITKGELYALLRHFYYVEVCDYEEDDLISLESLTESFSGYVSDSSEPLFKVSAY